MYCLRLALESLPQWLCVGGPLSSDALEGCPIVFDLVALDADVGLHPGDRSVQPVLLAAEEGCLDAYGAFH